MHTVFLVLHTKSNRLQHFSAECRQFYSRTLNAEISLLGNFAERETEFLGVAEATDVTVERREHLSFAVVRQNSLQTSQLLCAERLAVAARHHLHQLGVRLESDELAQEHVHVETASAVQQIYLTEHTTRRVHRPARRALRQSLVFDTVELKHNLAYAVVTTTIQLRFDGRSTAYQRSLSSQ